MVKDKKTKTFSVRVSEENAELFKIGCYMSGTTPSKFLRMMMDASINGVKLAEQKGDINIEDFKTLLND